MPFTFFKKQIDLPTPPRFVKFIRLASLLTQGAARTVPTSDHVPELMNAQSSPLAGIAAIADAVSWQAGTIIWCREKRRACRDLLRRFQRLFPWAQSAA